MSEKKAPTMESAAKRSTRAGATTRTATKSKSAAGGGRSARFSAEERAAMQERAREAKAEARANRNRADGERELLAAIAKMKGTDRVMATRVHEVVSETAPDLAPKTWYGMPAYAKDGKVICFFQSAQKFNARYATVGFTDTAGLDAGAMWPTSFALKELTAAEEAKIARLVKKAVR